ncbi:MAG: chloride channel protein, partial [Pseudobdellovibrio sp.]
FVPVAGGLIIGLIARFGSEKIRGHGIPEALEAILFGKSIMQARVALLKPISSALSIGSGGPFGAEGPIIMTGGAVGSLISQFLHLSSVERKTLLVAGAAAGMTAIFSTPIAAVLLAVELLLFEWKPRSLVPVALACSTAAVLRPFLMDAGPIFPMALHSSFSNTALLSAALVGLLAGAFASLLSTSMYKIEDLFMKLPIHWMWWPAIGGLAVGIGGYFEPRALGVGYSIIGGLLNGQFSNQELILLFVVKVLIWVLALASGTSGGVLAPLLIFGCSLGTLESSFLPGSLPPDTWALINMGAMMSGMLRSPFTAILFSFELTQNTESLLPLLIASLCSYAFTVMFMKRSILTEKIARRGYDIFCEYAVDPLERLTVSQVMTKSPQVLSAEMSFKEVLTKFSAGTHSGYPVVDHENNVVGIITDADLEKTSLLDDVTKLTAKDLIQKDPVTIFTEQSCGAAAEKMAQFEIGRILVVSYRNPKELIGIVTRSDLLKARHHQFSEEFRKERIFFNALDAKNK